MAARGAQQPTLAAFLRNRPLAAAVPDGATAHAGDGDAALTVGGAPRRTFQKRPKRPRAVLGELSVNGRVDAEGELPAEVAEGAALADAAPSERGDPSGSSSPAAAQPSASAARSVPVTLRQMQLDLGQRGFGWATCPRCGLVFSRGDVDDERVHARYCRHTTPGVTVMLPQSPGERVVWRPSAGDMHPHRAGCVVVVCPPPGHLPPRPGVATITRRLTAVCAALESALGTAPGWLLVPRSLRVYVYLDRGRQVVGAALVEPIMAAHPATAGEGTPPVTAAVGIRALWTHASWRRRGVAATLVDAARATTVFGYTAPASRTAFTQPTAAGGAFAAAYCGTPDYLVYG